MGQYGVIYIIRNKVRDKEEDLFKVGYSYDPERRCDDLTKEPSNIGKFETVALFPVSDMARAEKECHKELRRYRFQKGKEFFKGNLKEIISIVEKVVSNYRPENVVPEIKEDRLEPELPVALEPELPVANEGNLNSKKSFFSKTTFTNERLDREIRQKVKNYTDQINQNFKTLEEKHGDQPDKGSFNDLKKDDD